jgi:hypothetical protein
VRPEYDLIRPDLQIPDYPPDSGEAITTPPERTSGGSGAGSAIPMSVVRSPRVDPRRPLSLPTCSPSYIRQGIKRFVNVEICALPIAAAVTRASSGAADSKAWTARRSKGQAPLRLRPATRDGVRFAQRHELRVQFLLWN